MHARTRMQLLKMPGKVAEGLVSDTCNNHYSACPVRTLQAAKKGLTNPGLFCSSTFYLYQTIK